MWMSGLNILFCLGFVQVASGWDKEEDKLGKGHHYRYSFYWEYENTGLNLPNTHFTRFDPARSRIGVLMRGYYEDARIRTKQLNNIRFAVEETYQYEVGYLMHEMYDKYKKLVEQYNKGERNRSLDYLRLYKNKKPHIKRDSLIFGNDKIERTEVAQKLYFEIFHLSNMIHEITRKWGVSSKDQGQSFQGRPKFFYDKKEYDAYQAELKKQREKIERNIRKEKFKRLDKEYKANLKANEKKKMPKSHEEVGLGKDNDYKANEFIKIRMKEQGWEKWQENRQNVSLYKYKPSFFKYDYGWDVPYLPGQGEE